VDHDCQLIIREEGGVAETKIWFIIVQQPQLRRINTGEGGLLARQKKTEEVRTPVMNIDTEYGTAILKYDHKGTLWDRFHDEFL
jgi:hypothetical protein